MSKKKWIFTASAALLASAVILTACSTTSKDSSSTKETTTVQTSKLSTGDVTTTLDKVDNTKWLYNADDKVYYQIGISYAATPTDADQQTLSIFVPEAYMTAKDNGDGTYTCEVNPKGTVGNYTAESAPIVIPINTPGYSAMSALTAYSSDAATYTNEGFIYVSAGLRGRDSGAPGGVTDAKAAIRYIRYTADEIAGSTDSIFVYGMSGGGAQSAIIGSSGDSALYDDYLTEIGAVTGVSDAVAGVMAWCPVTSLDTADMAYEWNLGSSRTDLSEDEQTISDGLAEAYAEYINSLGLKDSDGNTLKLEKSDTGIYQAGSYYDYIKETIESSLNTFLANTTFPYDGSSTSSGGGMMGGGMPSGGMNISGLLSSIDSTKLQELIDAAGLDMDASQISTYSEDQIKELMSKIDISSLMGGAGPSGQAPSGAPSGQAPSGAPSGTESSEEATTSIEDVDNIQRTETTSSLDLTGTYNSAQEYIDALNAESEWVTYDEKTNTATITSVADFVKYLKPASKALAAFDALDKSQGENQLFGVDGTSIHWDSYVAEAAKGTDYEDDFATDLETTDSLGTDLTTRINMYSPLYYLASTSDGANSSNVASYWRIRTGINQGDTALSTEVNLALALENYGIEDVDFATVWGYGHTEAEITGNASENFIDWVNESLENSSK
ncbi:subtype A tannase [Streptococcus caprae]|uniref:Subtype A tannase n=1 Tax=Streptococcus caprae TaxID=1640501 RepID=A0ABV8CTX9_9STRE